MRFTILLCTLNRKELMQQAIKSLLAQSFADFEILIVDQSDKADEGITNMDSRIRYLHSSVKGLSLNRNIGIREAAGDYICLMDDDATYEKNTLKEFERIIHTENPDFLCGKMLDPVTKAISLHGMKNEQNVIGYNNILEFCSSPSLVIRTEVAKKYLFDEEFGVGTHWGSGEEVDLVLRGMYDGGTVVYVENAIVYHPAVNKYELSIKKANCYSMGYGALCAKHYCQYGNKSMKRYYDTAIIKHFGGIVYSILYFNKHMVEFYSKSIRYKILGYKEYKLKYIVSKN